jgi:hypothetical protein
MLLAYVCYLHLHVEQHVARNISDHNTRSFVSIGILMALGYFSVSF